jgi:predicted ATP-grasp superfamily ATP-dependent carboligase
MLRAVLEDLACCPGVQVVTLVDPGLLAAFTGPLAGVQAHPARPDAGEQTFRRLARRVAHTLVIAPEFDDLLYTRCLWAQQEGSDLLGPSPETVRQAGDKLELARRLRAAGVPTPPAELLGAAQPAFPAVCKPRHGAGSQATFLVRDAVELAECLAGSVAEGWGGERIVQPHVPGLAVSVAFLAGPGRLLALPAGEQMLSADGRFRYRGGRLPLPPDLAQRARALAERVVRALPGLAGYFGVDLVLGEPAGPSWEGQPCLSSSRGAGGPPAASPQQASRPHHDEPGDVVIEINPRLTTSYVGLRALADFNLAEALLAVARGREPPRWRWKNETILFRPDGRLRRLGPP